MALVKTKMILTLTLLLNTQKVISQDPCQNYEILSDPSRSPLFLDITEAYRHDYLLVTGWYRAETDGQSLTLTDTPPNVGFCQAAQPMWLCDQGGTADQVSCTENVENTGTDNDTIEATVCTVHLHNTAYRRHHICIKNCGTFHVYYLKTAATQLERYCFGEISKLETTGVFTQHKTDRFNFDEATKEQDMAVTSDRWPTDTGGQEVSTNEKGLVEITTDFKPKVGHSVAPGNSPLKWHIAVGLLAVLLFIAIGIIITCAISRYLQTPKVHNLEANISDTLSTKNNAYHIEGNHYEVMYDEPDTMNGGYAVLNSPSKCKSEVLNNCENEGALKMAMQDQAPFPSITEKAIHGQNPYA